MNLQRSFAFYKDRFADASDFTFVFAGSFDVAAIKPLVERYLASLPSLKRQRDLEERGHHAAAGRRREGRAQGDRAEEPGRHRVHRRRSRSTPRTRWRSTRSASSSRAGCAGACARRCAAPTASEVEANATKIPEPRYSVTIEFGCDPERTEELVATLLREIERLKAAGADRPRGGRRPRGADGRPPDRHGREQPAGGSRSSSATNSSQDVMEFFNLPAEYQKLDALAVQDAARRESRHRQLRAGHAVPGGGAGAKK